MMIKNKQIMYVTLFLIISWSIVSMADPSKSDLTAAKNSDGCNLIPYTDKKTTCKASQTGVHVNTSCNGSSQSCETATNCVEARAGVKDSFESTITRLENNKKNLWKGNSQTNKDKRRLANSIITKIRAGQPNHQIALRNAKILKANLCG